LEDVLVCCWIGYQVWTSLCIVS